MINKKSRLLVLDYPFVLAFKKKGQDKYSLIGGTIEKKESPIETLIREVQEEADIKIKESDVIFFEQIEEIKNNVKRERYYFILKNNNYNFKVVETDKFEALEWVDFFDNKHKFKTLDRKVIQKSFNSEHDFVNDKIY